MPSTDSSSWLKRSFFLMPMSLRISSVHFLPSTSTVAAIGQFATWTAGRRTSPFSSASLTAVSSVKLAPHSRESRLKSATP